MQLELSLSTLYDGEASVAEMVGMMKRLGFTASRMEPVAFDSQSGALLQVDGVFLPDP